MNNDKNIWEDEPMVEKEVFDGNDDIDPNDILKDGTDYTDIVEKYKNRKRNIAILSIILAIILGLTIFFGSKYILENPEVKKEEPKTTVSQSSEPEEIPSLSPDYTQPPNPVSDLVPNRPEPNNEEIKAFVEKDTIQTSHGNIITISNADISSTIHECSVRNATDFCNVGTITFNNSEYYGYYLKDAAGSRFFENPAAFKEVSINGATAAATLTVNAINGSDTPVLVIVESDGTGFMFVSSDNNDASLNSLAEAITVS